MSVTLLAYCILIVPMKAEQCITPYQNHIIEYISNNLNEASILYLGDKTSTTDCINSCIHLNYLCAKSNSNVFSYTDDPSNPYIFDNTLCSAQSTHTGTGSSYGAFALLTSNILSREYIIEIELTVTSGEQGGIVFKAQQGPDWNYWVLMNPSKDTLPTGPYETNWDSSWWDDSSTFATSYNTKYNLSIHIIDNTFQRYLNQQPIGNVYVVDESLWSQSYAGLFTWRGTVIYHSFQLKFPNTNAYDDVDKFHCRAYMYDKQQGSCYGYYGNNFTLMENSITSDLTENYDSGIVYETCAPTQYPTILEPTSSEPTTTEPTTSTEPTTTAPTTTAPTTLEPTTSKPTTLEPTTSEPTTSEPSSSPIDSININSTTTTPIDTTKFTATLTKSDADAEITENNTEDANIDSDDITSNEKKSKFVYYMMIIITGTLFLFLICCIILLYTGKRRKQKKSIFETDVKNAVGVETRSPTSTQTNMFSAYTVPVTEETNVYNNVFGNSLTNVAGSGTCNVVLNENYEMDGPNINDIVFGNSLTNIAGQAVSETSDSVLNDITAGGPDVDHEVEIEMQDVFTTPNGNDLIRTTTTAGYDQDETMNPNLKDDEFIIQNEGDNIYNNF